MLSRSSSEAPPNLDANLLVDIFHELNLSLDMIHELMMSNKAINSANLLVDIFRNINLSLDVVHGLMMQNEALNAVFKISDFWKDKTKQCFADEYKKIALTENANWYVIFKQLYDSYYDGLPERTIRIFWAVRENDIHALAELALTFNELNLSDNTGTRLKHYIGSSRNQDLMDFVTETVVNPYYLPNNTYDKLIVDSMNEGLFHYLAQFNQLAPDSLMSFVMTEINLIDVNTNRGNAPLHYAAIHGHVKVIHAWINAGFPIDRLNGNKSTPLQIATWAGQIDAMTTLLDRGPTLNAGNITPPLIIAATRGHCSAFATLIQRGANAGLQINDLSALLYSAALGGNTDIFDYVIGNTREKQINIGDSLNKTALHYAVKGGNFKTYQTLLAKNADIFAVCNKGNTLLHYAAMGMNVDIIKDIINMELLDINAENKEGETPLHCAASVNRKLSHEIIDIFLKAGANVHAMTKHQPGPDEDEDNDYPHGGRETPLHYAAKANDVVTVEKLLAAGANPNAASSNGSTPLFHAIEYANRSMRVFDKLMEAGAQVNVATMSIEIDEGDDPYMGAGETPLHLATRHDNLPAAERLLKAGANVNARDDAGETPIYAAVLKEKKDMLALLISHGAMVNVKNIYGERPLGECIRMPPFSFLQHAEILVSNGASVGKNTYLDEYSSHNFSEMDISEYTLKMILNAAPNVKRLQLENTRIIPSTRTGGDELEPNALPTLETIHIMGTEDGLSSVLKMILKAAPQATLSISEESNPADLHHEIFTTCRAVYEETGHAGAGFVFAFACQSGCILGIPLNLAYAKEIYTSLGFKEEANAVEAKINASRVSEVGLFAPPSSEAQTPEKRGSENENSLSKRQKK